MWILLAIAMAIPPPQLPDREPAADWVEPWKHAGLTQRDELDVAVHLQATPDPNRWRLQVRRDGTPLREVAVERPRDVADREEIAFLALGLLRDLEEARASRPSAPEPPSAPPLPPPPSPAVEPTPPPAAPWFRLDDPFEAPISHLVLPPPPSGAQARRPVPDPSEELPDLAPSELLADPAEEQESPPPPPPRRFGLQVAPLTLTAGVSMTNSTSAPAWRVGLQVPVRTGHFVSWYADFGILPTTELFSEGDAFASTFQGEGRVGFSPNHPWLHLGTHVGIAARTYTQNGDLIQSHLVPQAGAYTGVQLGPAHVAMEVLSDLIRIDARMPDQSIRRGGTSHLRLHVGVRFGRRGDPLPRPTTSPDETEEMP